MIFFFAFASSNLYVGTMGRIALIRQIGSHSESSVVTDHLSVGLHVPPGVLIWELHFFHQFILLGWSMQTSSFSFSRVVVGKLDSTVSSKSPTKFLRCKKYLCSSQNLIDEIYRSGYVPQTILLRVFFFLQKLVTPWSMSSYIRSWFYCCSGCILRQE